MRLRGTAQLLMAFALALQAQQSMPRMTTVEPPNGKVGDVLAVAGENLDKVHVTEIYLTDGKKDHKIEMTEQEASSIKFKLPKTDPGRYSLMLLTAGKEPKLIEQPVKVTVE
ncbi:MAG: hypothetical protein WD696_05015 [Bryobacteraceae bacterium]